MRIEGTNPWSSLEGLNANRLDNLRPELDNEESLAQTDDARLSDEAASASAMVARLREVGDLRNEKVEPLRRAIADGTYAVSPTQIAEAMRSDLAGWLGRR